MDPFELLKEDHRKVATLFQEIESASDDAKSNLFAQLKSELDLHANIEETIFYPALENNGETRDITLEAYEEHKVVKELLAELQSRTPDEEWSAQLKVLRENVEHHVEEEEGELFDKAGGVLSAEETEEIGDQIEAAKAGTLTTPAALATNDKPAKAPRAASKKAGKRRGLLGALASIVGLGGTSEERSTSRRTSRPSKKKSATKSGTKRLPKAAGKASTRISSKKTQKAASKKTTAKPTRSRVAAKAGTKKKASVKNRATALKRSGTKKVGSKKRSSGRSKKR